MKQKTELFWLADSIILCMLLVAAVITVK